MFILFNFRGDGGEMVKDKLDKQINEEGTHTWRCPEGWLGVEDVKKSLNDYKKRLRKVGVGENVSSSKIIGVELAIYELNEIMGNKLK